MGPVVVVEWLHILCGIVWLGGVLTTELVIHPALAGLPAVDRQRLVSRYGVAQKRVIRPAVLGVIVLGILRGTVWGPIRSWEALDTAYGLTWTAALVISVGAFVWGRYVITPAYIRIGTLPASAANDAGATAVWQSDLTEAIASLRRRGLIQLVALLGVVGCMVLLRVGL